ncbi:MAG: DUF1592 domain-containing protein [Polyangiaceae bacterium]|nr:DUF1592 domain-containing protein [Polyangiaceae bacterium]
MRGGRSLLLSSVLAFGGCTGEIGGTDKTPPTSGPECTTTASVGAPVPMRRLTVLQAQRSVFDVLAVEADLAVPDERLFTFRSNISSSIDFVGARGYLDFAEAAVAASDLSACATAGEACDAWLYDDVGKRLFRRPLTEDERTRYSTLFDAGAQEEGGALEGARWVLEGFLQSPSFLYLDEVVKDDGTLDDASMASRLAFTIWGSGPDADLLARAAAGELTTVDQVRAEAERMLADPRSVGGLTDFVDQWLRLDRLNDPDARPDLEALGAETLAAMRGEPVQLFAMLVHNDGDLPTLLTTTETAPLAPMQSVYGADILDASGATFVLDPARRAGLLSLPGVMAALSHAEATSPTLRGHAVLANLLCTPPSPPPAGVSVTLPDIGEGKTTRERLEAHFSDATCAACHKPMDGMGFAFESIDWLGRSRDTEFGKPIDDTSTFPLDGEDVTVDGPSGLAGALQDSEDAATCVARQWISYAAGVPDKKEAACLVESISAELGQAGGLRAMILASVTADWYRRGPGEAP